jgi:hypothetical protein
MKLWVLALAVLAAMVSAAQEGDWMLSREVAEKADVFASFPLRVGNRWIYQREHRDGDPDWPNIVRWTLQVTVAGHVAVPEGTIVLRKAEASNIRVVAAHGRSERQIQAMQQSVDLSADQFHYPVRGNYVYEFVYAGDEKSGSLSENFRKMLLDGDALPAFFFPMRAGMMWAERTREERDWAAFQQSQRANAGRASAPDHFYHWVVQGKGISGRVDFMPISREAFLLVYATIGGPVERWFENGVGVAREWNYHGGKHWENTMRLQQFVPAAGPRTKTPHPD